MSEYGSGDKLARGAKSAQFGGPAQDMTQFEYDFANMSVEEITVKYGISVADFDGYAAARLEGTALPDLVPVEQRDTFGVSFSVEDKRSSSLPDAVPVEAPAAKFPEKKFGAYHPILDRILVKRVEPDPNMELLSDGSTRDKRTGFVMPAKYRQHSNTGVVLAMGQFVVMGGVKTPLGEILGLGDRVTYGDYNSEVTFLPETLVRSLCDNVQLNYIEDENGLRVIRIQDVRGVEPALSQEEIEAEAERLRFAQEYSANGTTSRPDVVLTASLEPENLDQERVNSVNSTKPGFISEAKSAEEEING